MEGNVHSHGFHGHAQLSNYGALSVLGIKLFAYDPLQNSLIAVSLVTAITQFLIACSPPLSGVTLKFLVAFAEGGLLGNIFMHMLPEIHLNYNSSLCILLGFLSFVVLDKLMRVIDSQPNGDELTHSHSHSHSHSRTHSRAPSRASSPETTILEAKGGDEHDPNQATAPVSMASNIGPLVNVFADSLHNLTDGVGLYMAFKQSTLHGISAFIIMCCHEVPHQFGDFALLINSGLQKSKARKIQLISACGTLTGCFLGNWLLGIGQFIEEMVSPLTTGVLLYVAAVNVLPEVLETDLAMSTRAKFMEFVVQSIGVGLGIAALAYLG